MDACVPGIVSGRGVALHPCEITVIPMTLNDELACASRGGFFSRYAGCYAREQSTRNPNANQIKRMQA
jgi:hypothetical protein